MKHIHLRGIIEGGTQTLKRIEVEAEADLNLEPTIAGSATNVLHAYAMDVSQMKSIFILADGALTIKTNSSGSPTNTITLVAGEPFFWRLGDGTLKDTGGATLADITALYITNPGTDPVSLYLSSLFDPTV